MLQEGLTASRLLALLQNQLQLSKNLKFADPNSNTDRTHRNDTIQWILSLNSSLKFSSETMVHSVMLLDRFIDLMKVQSKYMRCVAVSCLYIAVKINEEDEIIPSTGAFVRQTKCGLSVAEVLRMERIILSKLDWKLQTPTCVDFIHILHALMMINNPDMLDHLLDMTPSQHVAVVMRKLFVCLAQRSLVNHGHTTLALALLSLELEQFSTRWFPVVLSLQKLVGIDNTRLILCREHVTRYLMSTGRMNTAYHFSPSYFRKASRVKRKVTPIQSTEMYDGIKRLYSDDVLDEAAHISLELISEPEDDSVAPNAAVFAV